MISVDDILAGYESLPIKADNSVELMLQLRRERPDELQDLVVGLYERPLHHTGALLGATLDVMDDQAFYESVRRVWKNAMAMEAISEPLKEVLEHAALQWPQVFSGHWDDVLKLARNRYPLTIDLPNAWHALDEQTAQDWCSRLPAGVSLDGVDGNRVRALLMSRKPSHVHDVWRRMLPNTETSLARAWLQIAGFAEEGNDLRRLHNERPYHISPSSGVWRSMLAEQPSWTRAIWKVHPTWRREAPGDLILPMGGTAPGYCGLCHEPLHRLMQLKQPGITGISSSSPIELATCLSCQGWEEDTLFFRHDVAGLPHPHTSQVREVPLQPQFRTLPLVEFEASLVQAPARWIWQDWGASNARQNLNRIGGPPSWIQSAFYPECPDCQRQMFFIAQLDSGLPQLNDEEWLWGSGGVNYSFWCSSCRVSAHFWQCT